MFNGELFGVLYGLLLGVKDLEDIVGLLMMYGFFIVCSNVLM